MLPIFLLLISFFASPISASPASQPPSFVVNILYQRLYPTFSTHSHTSPTVLPVPFSLQFILADDLGYGEPSCWPSNSTHGRIDTPNYCKLAEEGVKFTSAYTGNTVCSPSRCSLLTGLHQGHARIRGNLPYDYGDYPLAADDMTWSAVLRSGGYRVRGVGKWGLGGLNTSGSPLRHGFESWFGQIDTWQCHDMYPITSVTANESTFPLPCNEDASRSRCMAANSSCVFSTSLFIQHALDDLSFLSKQPQPFFLYVAYTDPHAGTWSQTNLTEIGNPVPSDAPYAQQPWPDVFKDHAASITSYVDQGIGEIRQAVQRIPDDREVILFLASDNGAHNEGGAYNYTFFDSSGPLRGFKRSLYEGGVRTPSVVWSLRGSVRGGVETDFPFAFWDVFPTLLALSGLPAPSNTSLDGISIAPLLLQGPQAQPPRPASHPILFEFCALPFGQLTPGWGHALRQGDLKIVNFHKDDPLQLYNLSQDLAEEHDLASLFPETVKQLDALFWQQHTDSPLFPATDNCKLSF